MKRLCVLLPAKDEAVGIGKTVKSILQAGVLPADVYVIDDGSSDGTGEIAASFGVNVARNPKNIGKAHSLARLASVFDLVHRYDYICLMDADTQVSEDYFQAVMSSFSEPGVAVVCGRAKSTPHNWLTAYRCLAYWISHAIYKDGQSNMGVITVTPGCAAAFRADVFAQLEWSSDTIVETWTAPFKSIARNWARLSTRSAPWSPPRTPERFATTSSRCIAGIPAPGR